jgi:hypothetical protein
MKVCATALFAVALSFVPARFTTGDDRLDSCLRGNRRHPAGVRNTPLRDYEGDGQQLGPLPAEGNVGVTERPWAGTARRAPTRLRPIRYDVGYRHHERSKRRFSEGSHVFEGVCSTPLRNAGYGRAGTTRRAPTGQREWHEAAWMSRLHRDYQRESHS